MAGDANLSFEAALERLEKIVQLLENGRLDLEASIMAYEEGMQLARYCLAQLQAAELRIQELSTDGEASLD
jgi:exodeoxyribonuclease VII small subunit